MNAALLTLFAVIGTLLVLIEWLGYRDTRRTNDAMRRHLERRERRWGEGDEWKRADDDESYRQDGG